MEYNLRITPADCRGHILVRLWTRIGHSISAAGKPNGIHQELDVQPGVPNEHR